MLIDITIHRLRKLNMSKFLIIYFQTSTLLVTIKPLFTSFLNSVNAFLTHSASSIKVIIIGIWSKLNKSLGRCKCWFLPYPNLPLKTVAPFISCMNLFYNF